MKYPVISKQPRRSVSVPELSGGVNLRDSISMISDNQLTECKNMWYHNGILRTRPACRAFSEYKIAGKSTDKIARKFKAFPNIKNDGKVLYSMQRIYKSSNNEVDIYKATINFWWQGSEISQVNSAGYINTQLYNSDFLNYLVIEKNGEMYCYLSNNKVYQTSKLSNAEFEEVNDADFYVPLVMSGCKPTGDKVYNIYVNSLIEGTAIEGYNLLGNYYKMQYTGVNRALLSTEDDKQPACYGLLHNVNRTVEKNNLMFADKIVQFKYKDNEGKTYVHQITLPSIKKDGGYLEKDKGDDGLYLFVNDYTIGLCTEEDGSAFKEYTKSDYIGENNVEIIAPCPNSVSNVEKVCKMTQAEWFGGSSQGISGGSRLFLTGNTTKNEKSLVVWSGLNDPLYFSENNYTYIGDKTQKTVCFGKQSDKLIIFKENETYYTYYQQNSEITGDDLTKQTIVDYASSSVYFPIVLINSAIGCDCPDTVQLCRNRLVWAHSSGKVYTLTSESQYTERNIFEVSEMIESKLKLEGDKLCSATSVDFEGYYLIFIENRVYVMGYNSYGYQYVYSFTKDEDANLKIPWYEWEFSFFNGDIQLYSYYYPTASVINGKLILCSFYNTKATEDTSINISMMAFVMDSDNTYTFDRAYSESGDKEFAIESSMQTKIFDFGVPNYRKNVDLVQLSLGNNEGSPIEVQFITDSGTEEESVVLAESETEPDSAGYIASVALNPCIRSVIRFGIKLSCKGILAVDSMSLHYRLLGGAK